jgi:DNA-binding response OmpR family regulator
MSEASGGNAKPRVLLVDDTDSVRTTLGMVLERNGFEVTTAANVNGALKLIGSEKFDVLLSDLHMPAHGDGLTVVSAMRHANPATVTLIFSGHPAMSEAAEAILRQTDGVLVKPMAPDRLVATILERMKTGSSGAIEVESVAKILQRETQATIADWLSRVKAEPQIITVKLSSADRCAHLPRLFGDLVRRLEFPLPLGTRALLSTSAAEHGVERRKQGYTAGMLVEESRMLQVSIFQTLQNNLDRVDFSVLLVGVMAIADEVDSQLAQQMAAYVAEAGVDGLTKVA